MKQDNSDARPAPMLPLRDRRALERESANIGRLLAERQPATIEEANAYLAQFMGKRIPQQPPHTELERAQDIMYDAWDAEGSRRVELARRALAVSPDCADAYVLLAEETAHTTQEACNLYALGVAAGERALGPDAFAERHGEFWGPLETRPYMRARAGLAGALAALDRPDEAIGHYRALLQLNPGDNQGNRYLLLRLLLELKRDADAGRLLKRYGDEASAEWLYSRALLAYRERQGHNPPGGPLLEAVSANPFVPAFMLGMVQPPDQPPTYIGLGDENEAVAYVFDNANAWLDTPGALPWMAQTLAKDRSAAAEIAAALQLLQDPGDIAPYMASMAGKLREEQEDKPIAPDVRLRPTLERCPAEWVDATVMHLGYRRKGKKADKITRIAKHLLDKNKLTALVAALPSEGREALGLVNKAGWIKLSVLTRRFGSIEHDGWWWTEEPPPSLIGQLRLAGLLYVGRTVIGGRRHKIAVIPSELRALLAQIIGG